jgi:hypothetical protein
VECSSSVRGIFLSAVVFLFALYGWHVDACQLVVFVFDCYGPMQRGLTVQDSNACCLEEEPVSVV